MRIRIAKDTQLTYELPIRILGARLVHTAGTTADIYDEEVVNDTPTAEKKKIALATNTILSDEDRPKKGVLFSTGCYVDWTAGEIFLDIE